MSKVFQILGDEFINKEGQSISLGRVQGKGKVIALYFSAHWCPPCRNFTPKLASFYESLKQGQNGSRFELLFLSSDKNEEEFSKYLDQMPWYALPYSKRNEKAKLSKYFRVSGIPTLIFLDGETGNVINKNGRSAVDNDPEGQKFPWKGKTLQDILNAGEYITNKDEKKSYENDIKGKVLGIYFSAHWCPPCKAFTPQLIELYNKMKDQKKAFEVIFVSSDQSADAFKEYFSGMPFLALPYDSEVKEELSDYFEIEGIPTLIIIDKTGRVITSSGRAVVSGDKDGKKFPWYPEPVEELNEISGPKINDEVCLIYNPAKDEEAAKQMKEILAPLGRECQEEAKREDKQQDLFFFVAPTEPNDIVESLCEFLNVNPEEKSLFIVDVPSAKIFKFELSVDDVEAEGEAESELVEGEAEGKVEGEAEGEVEGKTKAVAYRNPSMEEVIKFVRDYQNDLLVAKNIRD
ncbi:nucleoredoxin-like [Dendronephthya gigantea]|uniref:nucleoredoxin-like n=1 Tax=Dendronephthya gigantea TaxID=151771 RepID=UPI00106B12E4|nr:nucleoredoxin-like [Dendronephthya gigantea]